MIRDEEIILLDTVLLLTLSAENLPEGSMAYVEHIDYYFNLQASTLPPDNITVINANGKTGFQWLRAPVKRK